MRVAIVTPSEEFAASAGVRIRYDRLADAASLLKHTIDVVPIAELSSPGDIRHDAYVFAKTYTPLSCLLAWRLRQCGKRVGLDVFDDYFTQSADARLLRYRLWFAEMAELMDFFLCSTPRLAEAMAPLVGAAPLAVVPDPGEALDAHLMQFLLRRKLAEMAISPHIRVLWFGIGDNPYFPVGLRDLAAFGSEISGICRDGRSVSLRILTNARALTAEGLGMLRRLAVPYTIEEWTAERERDELRSAHVCFLPVNGQPFSRVKSLNRAVTALSSACQVLAAGFPLYEPLGAFIYESAPELGRDIESGTPRLRPETLGPLMARLGELANAYDEAETLLARLDRIAPPPADAPPQAFPADIAVVHGAMTDAALHKSAQRLNCLAVRGPACREDWNCQIRFDVKGGSTRVFVEDALAERAAAEFRERLVPFGKIKDLSFHELTGDGIRAAIGGLLTHPRPIKLVAAAPMIAADVMALLRAMFPDIHFITSDRLAAVAPGRRVSS
jgi:hypothetical protein